MGWKNSKHPKNHNVRVRIRKLLKRKQSFTHMLEELNKKKHGVTRHALGTHLRNMPDIEKKGLNKQGDTMWGFVE